MPYLDGRIAEVAARRLPYDALLEAQLFAPNIRDYAPLGFKHFVKFLYRRVFFVGDMQSIDCARCRTDDYVDLSAKLIDDSINDFLELNGIRVDKREPELALSGANVVDNGVNKAIVSQVGGGGRRSRSQMQRALSVCTRAQRRQTSRLGARNQAAQRFQKSPHAVYDPPADRHSACRRPSSRIPSNIAIIGSTI